MADEGVDSSLRMAAWALFEEASADLPHVAGAELHERFIGWMRRAA